MEDMCKALGLVAPRADYTGTVTEDEKRRVFAEASRQRMIALLCRQMKNMQIIQRTMHAGGDHEHVVNRYTGKRSGADVRDPELKDDLVMSFGNGLLGARAFYQLEQFAAQRGALGVRTRSSLDLHLVGL
jgi:hypothetical protein